MSNKNRKNEVNVVGDQMNFAGKEAYNLLRTNLKFAMRREGRNARVIGVTSSVHGEGKSLTTVNMAYSLASGGSKVLVLECDLRLPTLGAKLGLVGGSGLSNMLADIPVTDEILHTHVLTRNLNVILAGDIPPNPSELLGSKAMGTIIDKMSGYYDFILLDLPPVGAVSDALVVSKLVDGVVIVVRQDVTNSADLMNTVRQLNQVDANIAGFVFNDASSKHRGYGKAYGNYYYNKSN